MTRAVGWLAPNGAEIGVDEVGRGPLAGPVIAAAVVLDRNQPIPGLKDSKRLTTLRRQKLAVLIESNASAVALGWASVVEIDQLNILQASLLAMRRAVLKIAGPISMVYVDGNKLPSLPFPAMAVVGGDDRVPAISAASIVAKVYRDRLMTEMAEQFPVYGFEKHAGYPTALHRAALQRHGPCVHHRRSFAPVKNALVTKTQSTSSTNRQVNKGLADELVTAKRVTTV